MKEWLEMGLKCHGKSIRGYPVLTSVEVPRELESMSMKVLGMLVKVWKCC